MTDIKILFEDEHLAVCVKPCGILSQGDESGCENMVGILSERFGGYVGLIHRLDRGVGGVMVFAKTKGCAGKLCGMVADKEKFTKKYLAAVHGVPESAEGTYENLLFKDSALNKTFVVDRKRAGVKEARLFYKTLATVTHGEENMSLVEVTLDTGRTHQIRVQFSSRGTPLAGDKKYGARDNFHSFGLWAYSLCFSHPVTGKKMIFTEKPDFSELPWSIFGDNFDI